MESTSAPTAPDGGLANQRCHRFGSAVPKATAGDRRSPV